MVNITALMKGLPVSGLEPQDVASIHGLIDVPKDLEWRESLWLIEPPAGQHMPYIDPVKALEKLLCRQGAAQPEAMEQAREAAARMRREVADEHWINFLEPFEPDSPECLPVPDFVAWLRDESHRNDNKLQIPPDILDFLEQVARQASSATMFCVFSGPGSEQEPCSLANLPDQPTPYAMIEYVPGPQWNDIDPADWNKPDNPFLLWREAMRAIAQELEQKLGEPVYYFADLSNDLDDDLMHRFLVLHWCCTYRPDSSFVRYLLKICRANDVEELKAALINPASYTHPFKISHAFTLMETLQRFDCRFLPPQTHKTIAILFSTLEARNVAQSLLAQSIGAHALIIAPETLATEMWTEQTVHTCRSWRVLPLHDDTLNDPFALLALADALYVIADEKTSGTSFDLQLSEGAENLLWLALDSGMEAKYFSVDGRQLGNPETSLEKRGVPDRVTAFKERQAALKQ